MRVWGRVGQVNGVGGTWTLVETDANGFNQNVYFTALIQGLRLGLGESPFYANVGIPAQQSVITGIPPDYYVMNMQTLYSPYFASLMITRLVSSSPLYRVSAVALNGAILEVEVAV